MGGKSRKSGGISKALIDRIKNKEGSFGKKPTVKKERVLEKSKKIFPKFLDD